VTKCTDRYTTRSICFASNLFSSEGSKFRSELMCENFWQLASGNDGHDEDVLHDEDEEMLRALKASLEDARKKCVSAHIHTLTYTHTLWHIHINTDAYTHICTRTRTHKINMFWYFHAYILHLNESCHIWMSHVTYEWVMDSWWHNLSRRGK